MSLQALLSFAAALVLLYVVGYLVSAQRFGGWVGSMPINDPNWHLTVPITPTYRFFSPSFWRVAHQTDLAIRPGYWTFTLTSPKAEEITENVIGQPIFFVHQSLWQRIFPTLSKAD